MSMSSVIFPFLGRQRPPNEKDYRWSWKEDISLYVCPVIAKGNVFERIEAKT